MYLSPSVIGKRVRCFTAVPHRSLHCEGEIIGYQEAPTIIVRTANGEQAHWCASLSEIVRSTPANSVEAATRHHRGRKDMDGVTCLLDECALHYPKRKGHEDQVRTMLDSTVELGKELTPPSRPDPGYGLKDGGLPSRRGEEDLGGHC